MEQALYWGIMRLQLGMRIVQNTDVTQEGTKIHVTNAADLGNMDQLLYNTASNIVRLREVTVKLLE